jgi:hypothetical protein
MESGTLGSRRYVLKRTSHVNLNKNKEKETSREINKKKLEDFKRIK